MNDLERTNAIELMQQGELDIIGLVPWGSNYTFLAEICRGDESRQVIYKPRRGERPLWDFAAGTLCLRERAAYIVSDSLGWHIVPPTVIRNGEHGEGSVQLFIDHDTEINYFDFEGKYVEQIEKIQLFDVVINNADRKGGHILLDANQHLWGIDHGVSFHTQYKLRTVIWENAGAPIPSELLRALDTFAKRIHNPSDQTYEQLVKLLSEGEMMAMEQRILELQQNGVFPEPGPGRPYPWPLV